MTDLFDSLDPAPKIGDICGRKHGGNEQSQAANLLVEPHKAPMRDRIVELVRAAGEHGITLLELCDALGKTPNSISGRVSELLAEKPSRILRLDCQRGSCAVLVSRPR